MDCMSNDDVRNVTVRKSARVGYTKMIVAALGYFAEHKRRNQLVFQPVDQDADDFVKDEVDPMLRDVPAVRNVFPHFGMKSKNNTLSKKVFNGSTLDIRGGKAAKNYRRLSKDVVIYDEIDGFDPDIEGEGDPITLGDKRIEGATFPKSIRGSTPLIKGTSHIERCEQDADLRFAWHVPCPHCGHEQAIRWGGENVPYGFKWSGDDDKARAASAAYLCESCAALFTFEQYLTECFPRGRWIAEDGTWIGDGYFRSATGEILPPPESVAFHFWTGQAGQVPWPRIVAEFLKAKRDPSKLKTFVNTTLGESWDEDPGERTDADTLYATRRHHYAAEVPAGGLVIVAAVDTQDDRFEIQFDAYGADEERWSIAYTRLFGNPSQPLIWDKLEEQLRRRFTREDGAILQVMLATQDHGGHYSDEVNAFSKRMGVQFLIPVKGSSQSGRPVAVMPRKPNEKGVYLTTVGTDTAKALLHQRYKIGKPGPGFMHWPIRDEEFDRDYFVQLTAEERVKRYRNGRMEIAWEAKGRRNEAADVSVYSLAAVRILQQHFGVRLSETPPATPEPPRRVRRVAHSAYLGRR